MDRNCGMRQAQYTRVYQTYQLRSDTKCVAYLGFARTEFTVQFSDGTGFNTTLQQRVQRRRTGGQTNHVLSESSDFGSGRKPHWDDLFGLRQDFLCLGFGHPFDFTQLFHSRIGH